jgi:myo-inositol 2-dehydrogenase/D-chiro-inositol 1-dehydrogenase
MGMHYLDPVQYLLDKDDQAPVSVEIDALPDPAPQITDFHESVRTRKKFALHEQNRFWSCTMLNMAITAHRLNKNLKFDSKTLHFDGPAANALIDQPMRAPWKIDV